MNTVMEHFYSLLAAVLLDRIIGEFSFAHPLVGFGNLASKTESLFNGALKTTNQSSSAKSAAHLKIAGVVAVIILLLPSTLAVYWLTNQAGNLRWIFEAIVLYFTIGARSLEEHATAVADALKRDNLSEARLAVGKIVSRDTSNMQEVDAAKAAIESVLENGNDAVFAPIFWFLLGGAPLAVLLRLSNTLDAMWGYKNERFLHFGWAAARLDDVLMYIPARLTALSYAICGQFAVAISCWRNQGLKWYSPNAGPVMSAGAGALEVSLGGAAIYGGRLKDRLELGCGAPPQYRDIIRANNLVLRALILWVFLSGLTLIIKEIF